MVQLIPEKFKLGFEKNAYLCGGCIYSLRHDKDPKDFDFFIQSEKLSKELYTYFSSLPSVKPFKNFLKGKYNDMQVTITKYAISIGKYQIVIKYIGDPEKVLGEFDFKHNCFYYKNNQLKNVADWKYLDTNNLIFNEERARDISGCLLRIPKFIERGMKITKKEYAKILNKLCENGFDEAEKEIIRGYSTY